MREIKPCPFCGGPATYLSGTGVDLMTQNNNPAIGCMTCHFCIYAQGYHQKPTLIEAWNTRAEIKEPTELLKKYSQFLEERGYIDSDWWCEAPNAVDEFLKSEQGG